MTTSFPRFARNSHKLSNSKLQDKLKANDQESEIKLLEVGEIEEYSKNSLVNKSPEIVCHNSKDEKIIPCDSNKSLIIGLKD